MPQSLLPWIQENGVTWDHQALDIQSGEHEQGPFAIYAKRQFEVNDTLCTIPKSAVLSVKNTQIADLIEKEQLGGGLGLILAIMFEHSIAGKSQWYVFAKTVVTCSLLRLISHPKFQSASVMARLQAAMYPGHTGLPDVVGMGTYSLCPSVSISRCFGQIRNLKGWLEQSWLAKLQMTGNSRFGPCAVSSVLVCS